MSTIEMSSDLVQAANKLLGDTVPGVKDILCIGISLAKTAEKIPGMKGSEKLDAVLSCLREILAGPIKEKLTTEELQALHTTVDTIIPTAIHLTVEASRAGDFVKKNISKSFLCVPCRNKKTAVVAIPAIPVIPVVEVAPAPAPAPASTETREPEATQTSS